MARGLGYTPEKEARNFSYAQKELRSKRGCQLTPGPDIDSSLHVQFPNGFRFVFWPFTGWFNRIGGPGSGRGIHAMIQLSENLDNAGPKA